jgi:hypothetical protein
MTVPSESLQAGVNTFVNDLDHLSLTHYGMSANELLATLDQPDQQLKYARLIGVAIKLPFAKEEDIEPTRTKTGASKGLRWKPENEWREIGQGTWQLEAIRLLGEEELGRPLTDAEVFSFFKREAYQESRLGSIVVRVVRKHICDAPELPPTLKEAIEKAEKDGFRIGAPNVAGISVGAATTVAAALAPLFPPALAVAAAPLIGAIALWLLRVGIDVFCEWSKSQEVSIRDEEESTEMR